VRVVPPFLSDIGFILVILSLLFILFLFYTVARMREKNQIHIAFLFQMATMLVWGIGAAMLAFDHISGRPTQAWMVSVAYVGLILTPVGVLFLGLVFARTKIRLSWKHGLFLIIPLLSIIMVATNVRHGFFYQSIAYEGLTRSESFGAYFYLHSIYSYLCIMVGMGYLIVFSVKNAGFFSRQSILILVGIVISTGYNLLITVQIIDLPFHTNVISFFFTFLCIYLAIMKFDFLNIVPIALQQVVDHISDSFLVVDKDFYLIDFNRTFTETFGSLIRVSRKDNVQTLIQRDDLNPDLVELLNLVRNAIGRRLPERYERTLMIGGERRYFSVEITPIFTQGIYLSTIVLLKDISEIRKAMDTIQRNAEIMMEKERLASLGQLIGGIAHNLKTPIMSISGGIEGLTDLIDEYENSIGDDSVTGEDHKAIAADMAQWVRKIKPHCAYMSDIISTVKGQAAQFSISTDVSFTLDELIKRVQLLMKHELNRFHCLLRLSYETKNLIELKGDVNSLVQIFDNLIINAIHAYEGERGTIDLIVAEKDNRVLFTLRDYGKGIPVTVRDRLFKEMVTTKGKGGTGLGLYMSYATIKGRFDGDMWFESEPGQGTTFYVSLPCLALTRPA
jgi:PAS domain S-box-containing protein